MKVNYYIILYNFYIIIMINVEMTDVKYRIALLGATGEVGA